jgi:hypothetical protein
LTAFEDGRKPRTDGSPVFASLKVISSG